MFLTVLLQNINAELVSFKKFLKSNGLENTPIGNITKKEINDFLNSVLLKSSPRNRNNTLAVLNAIFSTLEEK